MFPMKSRRPSTWLPRIRLPRSWRERHDFAIIAAQQFGSAVLFKRLSDYPPLQFSNVSRGLALLFELGTKVLAS